MMIDERQKRINAHEIECRRYAEKAVQQLFSACTLVNGKDTPIKCHVDYRATGETKSGKIQTIDIEVKTISPEYAEKGTPLKVRKYRNMRKDQKNQLLIYLSVESDGTAYVYNLTSIDLERQAKHTIWNIKEVEWLKDSPKKPTPMYIIPKQLANYKLKIKLD